MKQECSSRVLQTSKVKEDNLVQSNLGLPSVSKNSEILVTYFTLTQAGYHNVSAIIKMLHSHMQKSDNIHNNYHSEITLKNGIKFPMFYRMSGGRKCLSIFKDDIKLFNKFLFENMPNMTTAPLDTICLDSEFPIIVEYLHQNLQMPHLKSSLLYKIIYDACTNGKRISYDKVLIKIENDNPKVELKLTAHRRLFNGLACYALDNESFSKIYEYFKASRKYHLSLVQKSKLFADNIPITVSNLRKIFQILKSEAKAKEKKLLHMCQNALLINKYDMEYELLLPNGTYQVLQFSKISNGANGERYVFKKKDIPLLKYYFGYISRQLYEDELTTQFLKLTEQHEELDILCQELALGYKELSMLYEALSKLKKEYSKEIKEVTKNKRKLNVTNHYEQFEETHNFNTVYSSPKIEVKRVPYIFQEGNFSDYGVLSTLVPVPFNNIYVTGSNTGYITIWNNDEEQSLYAPLVNFKLEPASIADLNVLKNKLIVMHNTGIKILNKKEGCIDYYQSQELKFDAIPECFTAFSNKQEQNFIYVYLSNNTIEVYKSEKEMPFKLIGKIKNLPIKSNGHAEKIIPLNNKRFLMLFNTGEIYNLPLKENISKDDVILVDNLASGIKCVSNLSNNMLFIITQDKKGHLYTINESCDTMHEECLINLRFNEKNKKIQNIFLRDSVCYIYLTDKYGFNSSMYKLAIDYKHIK